MIVTKKGDVDSMPNSYSCGKFLFTKIRDGSGGAYYDIVNIRAGGRYWDYNHWFSSTHEMDMYASSH